MKGTLTHLSSASPSLQSSYWAPPQESIPRVCAHTLLHSALLSIVWCIKDIVIADSRANLTTGYQESWQNWKGNTVIWPLTMRKGVSRGKWCLSRLRKEELFYVWTPDWGKNSEKVNSLYFTAGIVSVSAMDVRPSGSLFWTPWLAPINTGILRSELLDCFLSSVRTWTEPPCYPPPWRNSIYPTPSEMLQCMSS